MLCVKEGAYTMTCHVLAIGRLGWLLATLIAVPTAAVAATDPVNVDQSGVAIHGYDPVAYFLSAQPVQGKAALSYQWSGGTWLFASAENRQAFIDAPERYAPQFGGFCAYAASFGQFADTDPQAWTVIDDKLYLNYSLDVRDEWRAHSQALIRQAEQQWPAMVAPK